MMELFHGPLSCSMATRIALAEAGEEVVVTRVVLSTKKTADGRDYFKINPVGQVPALITREGTVLTEGPAVLQYVADLHPETGLAPDARSFARYELQKWLNLIASEVHKQIFAVLFNPGTPPEAKAYAKSIAPSRFDHLARHLEGREFLLDQFTVADCYLVTALNWAQRSGFDLQKWPALAAYFDRLMARPSVASVMADDVTAAAA